MIQISGEFRMMRMLYERERERGFVGFEEKGVIIRERNFYYTASLQKWKGKAKKEVQTYVCENNSSTSRETKRERESSANLLYYFTFIWCNSLSLLSGPSFSFRVLFKNHPYLYVIFFNCQKISCVKKMSKITPWKLVKSKKVSTSREWVALVGCASGVAFLLEKN